MIHFVALKIKTISFILQKKKRSVFLINNNELITIKIITRIKYISKPRCGSLS